ncbi:MAG TPA: YbhB/YbcL family Raf kinase inhibitor-like protein [Pseudolabrys sp.]|nr:YbhB/YbcL family Raf kinase inhibitor-like protein [Pseudolabrys sp.]
MIGIRQTLAAVAGVLLLTGAASAADIFTLSSSTFKDGAMMPKKVSGDIKTNPNCVGENVSPQFSWTGVPAGTKSFALVMTDPDGRGTGVDHWIAYGIPASVTGFAEGETSKASDKYIGGTGTAKLHTYIGPCTPPNTTPHHYTFILIATDLDPKALPAGITRLELFDKLQGHVKGSTGLVGLFKNPY